MSDDEPGWSYSDTYGGDKSVREWFAYLADHAFSQEALVSTLRFGLAETLLNRPVDQGRVLLQLRRVMENTHAVGEEIGPREGVVTASFPLFVKDDEQRGLLWRLEDAINELTTLRDDLASVGQLTKERQARTTELVDAIEHVFAGAKALRDDVAAARERSFVLNAIAVVAELRLPAVTRQLVAGGVFDRERVETYLFAPGDMDPECVASMVGGRFPERAAMLRSAAAVAQVAKVIDRWRDPQPGEGRWQAIADLLEQQGLWSGKGPATGDTVRVAYQGAKADSMYLGDLSKREPRNHFIERFASFALMFGLGRVTLVQFEHARASVLNADT